VRVLGLGLALIVLGSLYELIAGTYFRGFFDWRWPGSRHRGEPEKVLMARATTLMGGLLLIAGALAALV
jgi:hypothetical protein